MRKLYLAWQDPTSRCWHPIGRLTFDGKIYRFVYTKGACEAQSKCNFQPLVSFPDLNKIYEGEDLFPSFSNRVLSPSRPDFGDFVQWLNIPEDKDDPFALLARSGGRRATDTLEVFPCPEPDENGQYHIHFFVHGLQYLPPPSQERVSRLKPGEVLLMAYDFQNPYDNLALMLRTNDASPGDRYIVGYCPRYLKMDMLTILNSCSVQPKVLVERVNLPPAPFKFRLLCNMTGCWPCDFQPFLDKAYQPIKEDVLVG
ncbi:MAG: DNA-binding protein [Phycisphaerae bacterium]